MLLIEQHKALQEAIDSQRMAMAHEFGYAPHRRFREEELQELILAAQQDLKDEADFMRNDVAAVQDDKVFKVWLKEQTRINKQMQREQDVVMEIDDLVFAMMQGRM